MHAPFLKEISFSFSKGNNIYPYTVPIFKNSFELHFTKELTILVGENGCGKSTLLEIIAHHCQFNTFWGSRNNFSKELPDIDPIMKSLKFSWLPKISDGFFMRAESFYNFSKDLDEMAQTYGQGAYDFYGWESLNNQSHGEAFLSLFQNRIGNKGIYLFDEPEAALSPAKQLLFLWQLRQLQKTKNCQIIMATHSPILMSIPNSEVLYIDDEGDISEIEYQNTPHWNLYSRFISSPEKYIPPLTDS